MKLLPIKYKQPTDSSDARCALYALCNLFDDGGFLLYNNVGESTSHNREVEILRKYAEVSESVKRLEVKTIYPHAITPHDMPLQYSDAFNVSEHTGYYVPVLIDFASANPEIYHTVLALWGDVDCIIIDSKKDFPETMQHADVFKKVNIHGFRMLTAGEPDSSGEIQICQFAPDQLPHIFDVNEN